MIRNTTCRCICAIVCTLLLAGCGGGLRVTRENDRLRERVYELEQQIEQLTKRNTELKTELSQQSARPNSIPEEIRANTPRVADVTIGRLSHARDEDRDGYADKLVVYIQPTDGRARFIQLIGSLTVHAAILPPNANAVTIGQLSLSPAEVRDAYRATIKGYVYTIELPIQWPILHDSASIDECNVRAVYTDGYTGEEYSANRTVSLTPHTR